MAKFLIIWADGIGTAQAGYELAGQTSWAHTYGPEPSIYTLPRDCYYRRDSV